MSSETRNVTIADTSGGTGASALNFQRVGDSYYIDIDVTDGPSITLYPTRDEWQAIRRAMFDLTEV